MNDEVSASDGSESPLGRYVPLLVWLGAVICLLLIPLGIMKQGFLPPDDCLRHVGKVISGKSWGEIMVLRPGVEIDHNAGWHAILGAVYRATGWSADGLASFAVIALAWVFFFAPLAFFHRRPEAWIAALLAVLTAAPHLIFRFVLGRPYIFVMAAFAVILLVWIRRDREPGWPGLLVTVLLIGVAAWIHGGWYMYWIPAAGFFLAQRWRQGFAMTGCWLTGSFLGGLLTGHPIFFLKQQLNVLLSCFGHHTVQRVLVIEFKPFDGVFATLAIGAFLLVLLRDRESIERATLRNPLFMICALSWVFGFIVRRFWLDWGMPAFIVWVAIQLAPRLGRLLDAHGFTRLVASGLLCAGLLVSATADIDSRWTANLTTEYLDADNPEMAEWLPEPGGIIYNDSMTVFYSTFFRNPHASWRYMLGFESTFMPPDDLAIFRKIQWNYGTDEAYLPWVKKLRPEDRLILGRGKGAKPNIPELEWHYAATGTWIGRLPRSKTAEPATSPGSP